MNQDIGGSVFGMTAEGGLHSGGNTTYTRCNFSSATIQIDSNTCLRNCHVEDCEFVLPEGVDEVTIKANRSIFVNTKVRDGKKVQFRT